MATGVGGDGGDDVIATYLDIKGVHAITHLSHLMRAGLRTCDGTIYPRKFWAKRVWSVRNNITHAYHNEQTTFVSRSTSTHENDLFLFFRSSVLQCKRAVQIEKPDMGRHSNPRRHLRGFLETYFCLRRRMPFQIFQDPPRPSKRNTHGSS